MLRQEQILLVSFFVNFIQLNGNSFDLTAYRAF